MKKLKVNDYVTLDKPYQIANIRKINGKNYYELAVPIYMKEEDLTPMPEEEDLK